MSVPVREADLPDDGSGLPAPATSPAPQALHPTTRAPERERSPELTAYPSEDDLAARPTRPRRRRGGRGPRDISPRPGIIPGLDGLRAIAIIGVLVFHFAPHLLPGGYLGVDVFFVVSGFLITTLLLREIDTKGRIDLLGFWRRRARRLIPALVLVVVTSVTVARLIGGDLLVGIGRQALGALTFTTNWLEIGAGASYFHSTSPILFINFWSLAVEEQFYLLWPLSLVVALALTRTSRQRIIAVAGIGLASTVAMAALYTPGADATRVYYGTDTHLMGLMAGAALALAWADPSHRAGLRSGVWRRWRGLAVLGALGVLAAQMRWMTEDSPLTFRGGFLLASLATAVLIAGLLEADGPWRRLMHLRPLTWIGERSYGIYLWHWPVVVIMGALVPYAPGTGHALVVLGTALAITLGLSAASYTYLEQPVRRRGLRRSVRDLAAWVMTPWQVSRTPRIVAGLLALMLLATVVAVATAPEKSETQQQIEATEARLGESSTAAAGGGAQTTSGDAGELGAELGLMGGVETDKGADKKDDGGDAKKDKDADAKDAKGEKKSAKKDGTSTVRGSAYTPDADGLLVPAGEDLTAIGDSLVVTSADGLTYRFPGINYAAKSNRQWGDAAGVIDAAMAEGIIRDNVVLHLGSNGGVDEKGLRAALDVLGPDRNVVVMDLYVQASFTDKSNATIEKVLADYPNAIKGEWNATISKQPEVLQSDKVHPDIDGMHVYAKVVAKAFDALAERG